MKTLSQHIIEFDEVPFVKFPDLSESRMTEIINEELNEPHLLALAKQLRDDKKAGKSSFNFADILYNGFRIKWDQIDASNVTEYDHIDQKAIQAARAVLTKGNGIVLGLDSDWKYIYLYSNGGGSEKRRIRLSRDYAWSGLNARTGEKISASEAYLSIEQHCSHLVVITWDHNDMNTWSIRSQRSNNRRGMIPQGEEYDDYCKKLVKDNIRKWKEIIASNKAKSGAKLDEMNKLVSQAMDRMMKAMEVVQKDPVAWSDRAYELTGLMDRINGKRQYVGNERGHRWSDPSYRGSDGILELYKAYNRQYVDTVGKNTYGDPIKAKDELKRLEDSIKDEYQYLNDNYFSIFGV